MDMKRKISLVAYFVIAMMLLMLTLSGCEKTPVKVDNTSKSMSKENDDSVKLEYGKAVKLSDGTVCRLTEKPWTANYVLYVSFEVKNTTKKTVKVDPDSILNVYADYHALEPYDEYEEYDYEDSTISLKPGKKAICMASFYYSKEFKLLEVFAENYYWSFKDSEVEDYSYEFEDDEDDEDDYEPEIIDADAYSNSEICEIVLDFYEINFAHRPQISEVDYSDDNSVTVHLYDDMGTHAATVAIYDINRYTLHGVDVINDEEIDFSKSI